LSYKEIKELFPFLYKEGIRILILEGGEPLLWKDDNHNFNDLIKLANEYFYSVGITTNGTLPLNIPSDIIWVSIDGLKETHNKLRGKSFDKIINNIKNSTHPKIFANITINRLNVNEIEELIRFIAPLVKGITIQFFYPYPESKDLALSWSERKNILEKLIDLKKEGLPVSDSILALNSLKENDWKCESWMIANVDPDGSYTQGCYLQNRIDDDQPCKLCGFEAHTEISLAYQLNYEAILAGKKILDIF
jgi:MoaA/NifB/PqqE/SkfB family radical SAM enzyme